MNHEGEPVEPSDSPSVHGLTHHYAVFEGLGEGTSLDFGPIERVPMAFRGLWIINSEESPCSKCTDSLRLLRR